MDTYIIVRCLQQLKSEGKSLSDDPDEVQGWHAKVHATLSLVSPEILPILKPLGVYSDDNLDLIVKQELCILDVAIDFHNARRDDDASRDLHKDMEIYITKTFLKSWWFRIPCALVVVASGLFFGGVIQIGSMKIDIREEAKVALDDSKARIDEAKSSVMSSIEAIGQKAESTISDSQKRIDDEIRTKLNSTVESQIEEIEKASQKYVDDLTEKEAPNLKEHLVGTQKQLSTMANSVEGLDGQIDNMEIRLKKLDGVIERFDEATTSRGLAQIGNYLNQSQKFVVFQVIVSALVLLMSLGIVINFARIKFRNSAK